MLFWSRKLSTSMLLTPPISKTRIASAVLYSRRKSDSLQAALASVTPVRVLVSTTRQESDTATLAAKRQVSASLGSRTRIEIVKIIVVYRSIDFASSYFPVWFYPIAGRVGNCRRCLLALSNLPTAQTHTHTPLPPLPTNVHGLWVMLKAPLGN